MTNFKKDDLVIILDEVDGLAGKVGIIVDNEGPVMWVRLPGTEQVLNIHEENIKAPGFGQMQMTVL